uniref:G_PROTEIN_RECEP_F1_2 domain-containing protein n=1 Tax=Steinernema glaseri TaxID=37863 RepID=A0A1I7ZRL2_9BILA
MVFFSKRLQEFHQLVPIAGLCLADAVNAVGYVAAGIMRTNMYVTGTDDDTETQTGCFFSAHVILFFIGYQFTAITTCFLSVDCFVAVFFPDKHCQVTRRNKWFAIGCAGLWSIGMYVLAIIAMPMDSKLVLAAFCFLIDTLPSAFFDYLLGFRLVLITASVILCIPIIYRMRVIFLDSAVFQQFAFRYNKFRKMTITVGITALLALLLLVIPDVLMYFNIGGLKRFHVLFYLIGLNKCLANVFVYTLRETELRNAFVHYFRVLRGAATTVAPGEPATVNAIQIKQRPEATDRR